MRNVLSRAAAVAGGAALIALSLPAGTAAAASSADCPAASSTRLLTGGVLGSPDNKLWLYSPSSTQTVLCFDFAEPTGMPIAAGAVVLGAGVGATVPSVTTGSDASACTLELVDLADPVSFRIALGAVGTTVCFTLNDETTSVTLNGAGVSGTPSVSVWRDGINSWLDFAVCARHLVEFYTGDEGAYWDCAYDNDRIV